MKNYNREYQLYGIDKCMIKTKQKFSFKIDTSILFDILFEMHRYFDKQFVEQLHKEHLLLKQDYRNNLRLYFYYGDSNYIKNLGRINFPKYKATIKDKEEILNSFLYRCEKYDEKKIIDSIEEKYKQRINTNKADYSYAWLNYYNNKRTTNYEFSLFILDYTQEDFVKDCYDINEILNIIADVYERLENYRYFIFKLNGKLFNKNNEDVTWQILYKIGIFCENFIQFSDKYTPFKQERQIGVLMDFLNKRFYNYEKENEKIAKEFYNTISTGFVFEDCLISDNQETIILTYKKIKLDTTAVPCPSCMTTIQSGNSFPQMFLRSYECKNPSCKERSKSGRGKRFDEYSVYRYFKLTENKKTNQIDNDLYQKWRRDIFSHNNDAFEMILKYYAWDNEKVCISKDITISDKYERKVLTYKKQHIYNYAFESLPICKFLNNVINVIKKEPSDNNKKYALTNNIELICGDSSQIMDLFDSNEIGAAITSPPYYNAREYSTWKNLLLYIVDMTINAYKVYKVLKKDGYYLYNIGDIVDRDNIYVNSNMSKKRLQLGFISSLIFEKIGFTLAGNIIWDKGEVQSKRNSTINHYAGYVKCINCYEHVLVLKKGKTTNIVSNVKKITPVIKINSKGENFYKHSAPYPLDIVSLISPFVDKNKFILDPFLGSGTTLKWCKINNIKGVGIEKNEEYYLLAKENLINNNTLNYE